MDFYHNFRSKSSPVIHSGHRKEWVEEEQQPKVYKLILIIGAF